MLEKIKHLVRNSKQFHEAFLYVVMGLLTTIVNYLAYFILKSLFSLNTSFFLLLANSLAWIISVLFAFVTNRKYVFKSKKKGFRHISVELFMFIVSRLGSFFLFDILFFHFFVNMFQINDFLTKILSNIGTILFNYFISKFFIFKKVSAS